MQCLLFFVHVMLGNLASPRRQDKVFVFHVFPILWCYLFYTEVQGQTDRSKGTQNNEKSLPCKLSQQYECKQQCSKKIRLTDISCRTSFGLSLKYGLVSPPDSRTETFIHNQRENEKKTILMIKILKLFLMKKKHAFVFRSNVSRQSFFVFFLSVSGAKTPDMLCRLKKYTGHFSLWSYTYATIYI